MKKAYEQETLVDLFEKISLCGKMYAREASGYDPFSSGKMDELPEAILYRARVIEQYIDEIRARAYHFQQKQYDAMSKEQKIKWHEEELQRYKGFMDDGEDIDHYYNKYLQPHTYQILILESCSDEFLNLPENKYTFGDK